MPADPEWGKALDGLVRGAAAMLGFVPTALVARWLWHQREWKAGRRRLVGWDLLWEVPAALFGAVVGGGLAEWLGLSGLAAQAVVGFVAWLGPRGIEELLRFLAQRYAGKIADRVAVKED